MNTSLVRDHTGKLHLRVAGHYAVGAQVQGIVTDEHGDLVTIVRIPLKHVLMDEQDNVVPMRPRE
jgi:hypothetical protein